MCMYMRCVHVCICAFSPHSRLRCVGSSFSGVGMCTHACLHNVFMCMSMCMCMYASCAIVHVHVRVSGAADGVAVECRHEEE